MKLNNYNTIKYKQVIMKWQKMQNLKTKLVGFNDLLMKFINLFFIK